MATKKLDLVAMIMTYEDGTLEANKTLELFGELVRTGQAWTLQGHYGRTATQLIEQGYISTSGEVLKTL